MAEHVTLVHRAHGARVTVAADQAERWTSAGFAKEKQAAPDKEPAAEKKTAPRKRSAAKKTQPDED